MPPLRAPVARRDLTVRARDDAPRAEPAEDWPMTSPRSTHRRRFLQQAALAGGGLLAWHPAADAMVRLATGMPRSVSPVRVRGRVRAGGAGIGGVAVTDGQSVVRTAADGSFTLIADGHQPFVHVSVPGQCEIPRNATGTARFYQPLVPTRAGEMDAVFDLTRRERSAERHAFLVLPDTQTEDAEDMAKLHAETMPDIRTWVDGQDGLPVFGASVGDIMFDKLELYPEYERAVQKTGVPFFQVVGNHDLDFAARSAELTVSTFMGHFGPPYYSFNVGAVHYVVLQDVLWHGTGYVGYVDERQLRWLEADLALVEPGAPVVVLLHIPLCSLRYKRDGETRPRPGTSVNNRAAIYERLDPFAAHVISGHTHENEHVFEGGVHEHVHGTTCGAWWTGPICHDGTPAGYGIYEVQDERIQWTYKGTGRPLDEQMRLYAPGADPTAPDELIANVWNWDPAWRVEWLADGAARGPMARRAGFDPLSVELHRGPSLPAKRGWVEPGRTDHLFYTPISPDVREVEVRATDRFGRTFSERWRRG
jgi:hypothetical protein